MPKVSVIMSVYNGEKYLRESLESILNQTFKDFEFIIVNDGSTDRTLEILQKFERSDSRVKIISQKILGLTKSLNKAISHSKGEFIARQDSDDISLPERLEKQLNVIDKKSNIDLVASWYYIINENGENILLRKLPEAETVRRLLKFENLICHSSVMFKKTSFLVYGGYNENLQYGQDRFLWLKMRNFEIIEEPLLKFRWNLSSVTLARYKEQMAIRNFQVFFEDKQVRYISSLLIQQKDREKARELLKKYKTHSRHFVYWVLTFVPDFLIDLWMWNLRYSIKKILRCVIPYYRVIK